MAFSLSQNSDACGRCGKPLGGFPRSGGRVLGVHGSGSVHGPSSRRGRRAGALPQAVALAGHRHDLGVGQEAIKDRGGGGHVAEKDAPVLRGNLPTFLINESI